MTFIDFDIPIELRHCECCPQSPRPTFPMSQILNVNISETGQSQRKMRRNHFYRGRHSPSNDIFADYVLRDLNQHFKRKNVKYYYPGNCESYRKNASYDFLLCICCKRMRRHQTSRQICLDSHGHRCGIVLVDILLLDLVR